MSPPCPTPQASTFQNLERATTSPAVQQGVKQTLQKESQSPGRIEDSIARCVSIQLLPEHADTWLAC